MEQVTPDALLEAFRSAGALPYQPWIGSVQKDLQKERVEVSGWK
jgi:hypothetical protein